VKAEGLARENPKPYDRGLEVRRQWRDLSGRVVNLRQVRVGDLIVAEVYFRTDGQEVDNVAIVDALPGGVEVENTRLATSMKPAVPGGGGSQAAVPAPPTPATQPASAASRPAPPWELPDSFRGCEESKPDRVEWLDDRVVIFVSASNSPRVYRYLLRATSSGRFQLPQLQASCLYDPAVASLHGGGEVIVAK
jgi:hypothetical protein